MSRTLNVGLIGFGVVGAGVARLLLGDNKPFLRGRSFGLNLARIADLDITSDRGIAIPDGMLTTNAQDILTDPDIDIVVELIGGYDPAKQFTLQALERGASVVTANKALVARHGDELFEAADKHGASYMFEAAVGGGIPIIRGIMDGLNANRIEKIHGILNGTTNYILTAMARDGREYAEALEQAQKLGFAEADPTADISGADALNKIVILTRLAFGTTLSVDTVFCEGIENITKSDIEYARELGYVIKLLAIAKRTDDDALVVGVHPTLVRDGAILASVEDEFNAVEVVGDAVGRELFYGKGAGMMPTASAVVSDIVEIASRIEVGSPGNVGRITADGHGPEVADFDEIRMQYYLRFSIDDRPGVLADISRIFADETISIKSVIQKITSPNGTAPLVIMTHEAREGNMQAAMRRFEKLDSVRGSVQLIRVEDL